MKTVFGHFKCVYGEKVNMRTPEGTPNKTKKPARVTTSYFSATKYVRQYIIHKTVGF